MSSKISVSDISNVHIYNGATDLRKLQLCKEFRSELADSMAHKLDKLVATKLFQSQFKKFLPDDPDEDVHVKIRITENEIIVQKIDSLGDAIGRSKKIDLDKIQYLDDDDVEEVGKINQSILNKASKIYQKHLNKSSHRDYSLSPFRKRESRRASVRHRVPSVVRNERHSRSSSSERERSMSISSRGQPVSHKKNVRSASPTNSHRRVKTMRSDLALHTKKETHHQNDEQQVRNLEQRFNSTSPPSTPPLNTEQRLRNRSQCFDTVQSSTAHRSKSATPSSQDRHRNLEQNAHRMSTESGETLKARLPKNAPSVTPEHFDQLIKLSETLSASDLAGSTYFPGEHKEEFMRVPEGIRYAIYYQTYLLADPLDSLNPWPLGQTLFEGTSNSDLATNLCRAHAIRHFLLHTLASDFADIKGKNPSAELLRRFNQLPEEDKSVVYKQLEYIQSSDVPPHRGPAYAFCAADQFGATNKERSIAINRVLFDRVAEYHRHHNREKIKMLGEVFQEAYGNLQREMRLLQEEISQKTRTIETLNRAHS